MTKLSASVTITVASCIAACTQKLDAAGIPSARLDCIILLEDILGKDRSWLLAHPEYALAPNDLACMNTFVTRRETHIPLAYIRGHTEFYGRRFRVDKHVLQPRPETETMIGLLKSLALPLPDLPVIADVGTGSGALAITACLELPAARVFGTDIDPKCLAIARKNADLLRADVTFIEADLLHGLSGQVPAPDVILANLPYVPDDFQINLAASHEPRLAIFGGPDGLDLYRRMFKQIDDAAASRRPSLVLTEALPPQHHGLEALALLSGYKLRTAEGFIQAFVPD